jgi:succinate dehydrogenase / fumarate reductase flavoprotein subunit
VQIHPTCIPVHGDYQSKLTLMSESLRNDGRIWVPKKKEDAEAIRAGKLRPTEIPEEDRDYYLERRYPAFGNLVPRDVASRAAKERCDAGYGVGTGYAVYLDFADAIQHLGKETVEQKYGNLFQMYQKITDENPYETPMMIYPAIHYTMGGLWVDYELQTTIPGLFAAGEANFSDHGANRLGASALMQGLADGYFVLPYTLQNYLADQIYVGKISSASPEFDAAEKAVRQRINRLMEIGRVETRRATSLKTVDDFHKRLGKIMWEYCGMARNTESLTRAKQMVKELEDEFWKSVFIPGTANEFNPELEKACRLEDYFELAQLVIDDAIHREESCGGHFRTEHQTVDGETLRDDKHFMYVAAWEYQGHGQPETMEKEPLVYEHITIANRNYK